MKIEGQPLHKLKKAYRDARKACGLLNKVPDSAYRTISRSNLFKKMNRLRAAITRAYAEYKGFTVDHTKDHGFHVYFNGVKSKGYATLKECLKLINAYCAAMAKKAERATLDISQKQLIA